MKKLTNKQRCRKCIHRCVCLYQSYYDGLDEFERCKHYHPKQKPIAKDKTDNKKVLSCDNLYPKYVMSRDGYIGTFQYLDFNEFPVYRFAGGDRVADEWELEHGSDYREALEK